MSMMGTAADEAAEEVADEVADEAVDEALHKGRMWHWVEALNEWTSAKERGEALESRRRISLLYAYKVQERGTGEGGVAVSRASARSSPRIVTLGSDRRLSLTEQRMRTRTKQSPTPAAAPVSSAQVIWPAWRRRCHPRP